MNSTNKKLNLNEVLNVLSDSAQINKISEQLDDAHRVFRVNAISSYCEFNGELKRFVRHIYKTGLLIPRMISPRTALSEAIDLLDRHYGRGNGYYEAYLDAIDKKGKGIDFVLKSMTESIKEMKIEQEANWQLASTIDPCDKDAHLTIVKEIVDRFAPYLPEEIASGDPARFVNHYRQLIEMIISTDNLIEGIGSPMNFPRT